MYIYFPPKNCCECRIFTYSFICYLFIYLFYRFVNCYLFNYLFYLYLFVCSSLSVNILVCPFSGEHTAFSAISVHGYDGTIIVGHIFHYSFYTIIDVRGCLENNLRRRLPSTELLRWSRMKGECLCQGMIAFLKCGVHILNVCVVPFFNILINFTCEVLYTMNVCIVLIYTILNIFSFKVLNKIRSSDFPINNFLRILSCDVYGNICDMADCDIFSDCDIICCVVYVQFSSTPRTLFIILIICYMLFIYLFIFNSVNGSECLRDNKRFSANKIL